MTPIILLIFNATYSVTATGQRRVACCKAHEQLFWALRGAGQVGFGVVTKAQVKLHKIQEKYVGGKKLLTQYMLPFIEFSPDQHPRFKSPKKGCVSQFIHIKWCNRLLLLSYHAWRMS